MGMTKTPDEAAGGAAQRRRGTRPEDTSTKKGQRRPSTTRLEDYGATKQSETPCATTDMEEIRKLPEFSLNFDGRRGVGNGISAKSSGEVRDGKHQEGRTCTTAGSQEKNHESRQRPARTKEAAAETNPAELGK